MGKTANNNVIDIDGYGIAVVKEYYGKTGQENGLLHVHGVPYGKSSWKQHD